METYAYPTFCHSRFQGELCAYPTGFPTSSNTTQVSTVRAAGNPTQSSLYSPLQIIALLSACFIGIPLAGVLLVSVTRLLFPDPDLYVPREELDTCMTRNEYYNPSDTQESHRDQILSFSNA